MNTIKLKSTIMKKRPGLSWLVLSLVLILLGSGCARTPRQKVFVLGIDGLTFDLLVPWVKEGKLPHFAKLLEESSSTQLVSTIPPVSPTAWTSATTGMNPGKHGIFGFVKNYRHANDGSLDYTFNSALDRQTDPLWMILSERGKRSVVINVPCTSPPDKIKGVMISGFPLTSRTYFTHPPEFRLKIPRYGRIPERRFSEGSEQAYWEDNNEIMDRRVEVVNMLLEEEPWDLFFVVFTITDRMQHYFWKFMDPLHPQWDREKAKLYGDAIFQTYQRMDQFLGQLRSRLSEETTLLIMSDHGFGPVYKLVSAQNFIDQMGPLGKVDIISGDNFGASFYLIKHQGSSTNWRNIQDYAMAKKVLQQKLRELRDPITGQKVIGQIYDKEDLFWGPQTHRAPDILGLENPGFLFLSWHPTEDGRIFFEKDDPIFERVFSGYHLMNGVLIMAGKNVQSGVNNYQAQLMDIAPTVLYLLGEPVPEEMDGRILDAPISEEYVKNHPLDVRWAHQNKPRDMEELSDSTKVINEYIEEQLRAIGYVQ